jgi:hypothetical protein
MTNLQEYLAGTNHQDANSNLQFTQIAVGASVTLSFNAIADKTYSVLYKNALTEANWAKLVDVPASTTNAVTTLNDSLEGLAARFYRLTTPALQP